MTSRLNPDDQKHVEEYLHLSQHRVERRPLVVVLAVTIGLGLLSRFISYLTL